MYYRLEVHIWELTNGRKTTFYPQVIHAFNGATEKEAWELYEAHETTDEFFRGAVEDGGWDGIQLHAVTHMTRIP